MDRDPVDVGTKDLRIGFGVLGAMAAVSIILAIVTNL
jgi:hypothetical protein